MTSELWAIFGYNGVPFVAGYPKSLAWRLFLEFGMPHKDEGKIDTIERAEEMGYTCELVDCRKVEVREVVE